MRRCCCFCGIGIGSEGYHEGQTREGRCWFDIAGEELASGVGDHELGLVCCVVNTALV